MRIAGLLGLAAMAASLHAGSRVAVHDNGSVFAELTAYLESVGVLDLQTEALATRMLATVGIRLRWCVGKPKSDPAGGQVVDIRLRKATNRDP